MKTIIINYLKIENQVKKLHEKERNLRQRIKTELPKMEGRLAFEMLKKANLLDRFVMELTHKQKLEALAGQKGVIDITVGGGSYLNLNKFKSEGAWTSFDIYKIDGMGLRNTVLRLVKLEGWNVELLNAKDIIEMLQVRVPQLRGKWISLSGKIKHKAIKL